MIHLYTYIYKHTHTPLPLQPVSTYKLKIQHQIGLKARMIFMACLPDSTQNKTELNSTLMLENSEFRNH